MQKSYAMYKTRLCARAQLNPRIQTVAVALFHRQRVAADADIDLLVAQARRLPRRIIGLYGRKIDAQYVADQYISASKTQHQDLRKRGVAIDGATVRRRVVAQLDATVFFKCVDLVALAIGPTPRPHQEGVKIRNASSLGVVGIFAVEIAASHQIQTQGKSRYKFAHDTSEPARNLQERSPLAGDT
jgi:hypothetical protein